MSQVTLHGNPVNTSGQLPELQSQAPAFDLINSSMESKKLADYKNQVVLLNIVPSVDTPTCATSTREFNKRASEINNVKIITVSKDLPFALGRFCGAEGINDIETLSSFRSDFGQQYGVDLVDSALAGVHTRAVVIIDTAGKVAYTELVGEIADEPDYNQAFEKLKALSA